MGKELRESGGKIMGRGDFVRDVGGEREVSWRLRREMVNLALLLTPLAICIGNQMCGASRYSKRYRDSELL